MQSFEEVAFHESVKQIYDNTIIIVIGILSVLVVLAAYLSANVSLETLYIFLSLHFVLLLHRAYLYRSFKKNINLINTTEVANKWLNRYTFSVLLSSIAWGMSVYIFKDSSFIVQLVILVAIFGLGGAALLTLGILFQVYLVFLIPMFGLTAMLLLDRSYDSYHILALFLLLLAVYLLISAKRYSNTFKTSIIEKEKAKFYALEGKGHRENLYQETYFDKLTKLPNRFFFLRELKYKTLHNKNSQTPFTLLNIDIDNTKNINDSLGYEMGDRLIIECSNRLQNIIRTGDKLARSGGDEFVLILNNTDKKEEIKHFAQRVLDSLTQPLRIQSNLIYITSSIGISRYPHDSDTDLELMRYANAALNRAKDDGKNKFHFYSKEMTQQVYDRLLLGVELRKALEEKQFEVYYQPQINAKTDELIGMEALIRWRHPIKGMIKPDEFIPLAEEMGLVVEMDRMVMDEAMAQYVEWYQKGLNPGVLALNVSVKQLEREECTELLQRRLEEMKFKHEWLELEITEGAVMSNPSKMIEKLHEIADYGIKIAIDDFGTGYSSLMYVKQFPVTKLKIDKSFIDDVDKSESDKAIVKTIIALAQNLNLEILAEGVETNIQKEFLVQNGCENIQGYLYYKPMNAEECSPLLDQFKGR